MSVGVISPRVFATLVGVAVIMHNIMHYEPLCTTTNKLSRKDKLAKQNLENIIVIEAPVSVNSNEETIKKKRKSSYTFLRKDSNWSCC